jgi:polysaccharide biosynthesis transport protein
MAGQATAGQWSLTDLIDALRHRWRLIALMTLTVFVGGTIYAESLPAIYEGEAVTAFAPRRNVDPDVVLLLLPKYVAYVTAPSTVRDVAAELRESPDVLEGAIAATSTQDTGNLTITARLPSAKRAATAANALADEAVAFSRRDELIKGEIVTEALPPAGPASPPRRLMEAAALLVGLILGIALAALIERGRPKVRTWREVQDLTGYPVLGRFPPSRPLHARPAIGAFMDPVIGSSARTLRTNLEAQLRDRPANIIVVTSPTRGDGKTTISVLLAEGLARLGRMVLLMDADLRRPAILNMLWRGQGPTRGGGLSDVLRGQVPMSEAAVPGWRQGLWVLGTKEDPEAGDLLARRFAAVIAEARQRFDVVVVDTPPLLSTDDARTIARVADGVLLVIKAGTVTSSVHEAVLALESLNVPVLGVVGNRIRERRAAYYAYT